MANNESKSEMIIYRIEGSELEIKVRVQGDTLWLTQSEIAELFGVQRPAIVKHLHNIFQQGELDEQVVSSILEQTTIHGAIEGKTQTKKVKHYNLDAIISVGYRVNSTTATRFRQWATARLREYIIKGFTVDDERLKEAGGGGYWKELLDRIRDIRSSEKVFYRQVLDLYATATDYDAKADESLKFFKIVQNKFHFAAHGHTAAEVIYMRVDSDRPFAGLTTFKGKQPTQAEAMSAKNFLELNELKVLNNLVSAYFDLAEINALEQRPMKMADYIRELDNILKSAGRNILQDAGKISHEKATEKAAAEYRKYKAKNLSEVEKDYLEAIKGIVKKVKKKVKGERKVV